VKPSDEASQRGEVKTLEEAEQRFELNKARLRAKSEAAALTLEALLKQGSDGSPRSTSKTRRSP
jgi:hypothetical protein